ncbi:flavoprotein-like protein [Pelagophyceae sp. CCMP2097]|nr:flavoprotein-like protein [Pelagophyceae sp. CCMP2097]
MLVRARGAAVLARGRRALSIAVREPRVGLMSGSTRKGSVNTQLVHAAAALLAKRGAQVEIIDLDAFDLPMFGQEIEAAAWPEAATRLQAAFAACDAFAVSSPEYNGMPPPLLLNVYTWLSRGAGVAALQKTAVVLAASPGALGGMRALRPHREILTNLGCCVLPQMVAVGSAFAAFAADGALLEGAPAKMLEGACEALYVAAKHDANRAATAKLLNL